MGASSIGSAEFYERLSEVCNVDNLRLEKTVRWILEDFAKDTSISPRLVILIDEIMLSSKAAPVSETSRPNLDDLISELCYIQDGSNGRVRFVISSLSYSAIDKTTIMTTNYGRHWIKTFPLPTLSALSARCLILGSLLQHLCQMQNSNALSIDALTEALSLFRLQKTTQQIIEFPMTSPLDQWVLEKLVCFSI